MVNINNFKQLLKNLNFYNKNFPIPDIRFIKTGKYNNFHNILTNLSYFIFIRRHSLTNTNTKAASG